MKESVAAALICMMLSAAGAVAEQSGRDAAPPNGAAATPSRDAEAAAVVTPDAEPAKPSKPAAKGRVQPGSELSTMQTCRIHGQRTMEFIDQATRSVQQARLTRDPAQTRAALDQMQMSLSQMKQHMSICMERLVQAH